MGNHWVKSGDILGNCDIFPSTPQESSFCLFTWPRVLPLDHGAKAGPSPSGCLSFFQARHLEQQRGKETHVSFGHRHQLLWLAERLVTATVIMLSSFVFLLLYFPFLFPLFSLFPFNTRCFSLGYVFCKLCTSVREALTLPLSKWWENTWLRISCKSVKLLQL